ncbi:MAG: zinc ribbon domain-containing protein [Thermoplasmata archaeon]|nr:zinc ribbon domain-containing protein [Thermoplasmata archaeon]
MIVLAALVVLAVGTFTPGAGGTRFAPPSPPPTIASAHSLPGLGGEPSRAGLCATPADRACGLAGVEGSRPANLATNPPYIEFASMAYDAVDGYVVMFGGLDSSGSATSATWTYHNRTWTDLSGQLAKYPPARWAGSMVYDAADQQLLLFGGCVTLSCYPALADTWVFQGGHWTDLSATAGVAPSARGRAAMTWDGPDGYALLFGGSLGGATPQTLSDAWSFGHGHWTNLASNITGARPIGRLDASLAGGSTVPVVLFGGLNGSNIGDTWSYGHGVWTNLTASAGTAPSPRHGAMFAEDPLDGNLVLAGGYAYGTYFGDVWSLASGHWSRLTANEFPDGLYAGAMAFDAADGYLLVATGGEPSGVTDGTWTYVHGNWSLLNPKSNGFGGAFLIFALVFPVTFAVAILAGHRSRRRRERALQALFPPPPDSEVRWVPTVGRWALYRDGVVSGVFLTIFTLFLIAILIIPLAASGSGAAGAALLLLPAFVILLLLPFSVIYSSGRSVTRSVGTCASGVIVRRSKSDLRIPWAYLEPARFPARRGRFVFTYTYPGKTPMVGAILVTVDQARAILLHPNAPRWILSPMVAAIFGMTPAAPASPSLPSNDPLAPGPARPPPSPTRAGTGSARIGAQVQKCPRCGSLMTMRVRFCSNCGQPLPGTG